MTKTYSEIEKHIERLMFIGWVIAALFFFLLNLSISDLAGTNILLLGIFFSCGGERLHPSITKIVILLSTLCIPVYSLTVFSSSYLLDVVVLVVYVCYILALRTLTSSFKRDLEISYADRMITYNEIIDSYDSDLVQSVSDKLNKITLKNPLWLNGHEKEVERLADLIERSKAYTDEPTEISRGIEQIASKLEVDLEDVIAENEQTSVRVSIDDLLSGKSIIEDDEFIEINSSDFE